MEKFKKLIIIYSLILVAIIATILVGIHTINADKSSLSAQNFDAFNTKVGQSIKVIGTINRTLPENSNGWLIRYPFYGTALPNASVEESFFSKIFCRRAKFFFNAK